MTKLISVNVYFSFVFQSKWATGRLNSSTGRQLSWLSRIQNGEQRLAKDLIKNVYQKVWISILPQSSMWCWSMGAVHCIMSQVDKSTTSWLSFLFYTQLLKVIYDRSKTLLTNIVCFSERNIRYTKFTINNSEQCFIVQINPFKISLLCSRPGRLSSKHRYNYRQPTIVAYQSQILQFDWLAHSLSL